ncbi:family 16 glycosylhydrolase [Planktosalinus lacus]|uniref:GH16 domain-containing protein n=1 Tax=Planktosalinus lacus TaxID=1526573 RepID=A0A8J2VB70_9FLAO|nr:family 16 glycosylhydrolase [Planktosalinus lacus]GGD95374.1 hypothetical protein GCM10011312_18810 [Planktosalinus lacus]
MIKKLSLLLCLILVMGCQEDDAKFGQLQAPTNLQIQVEVLNADNDNPFGDGSGSVNFTATAENAISYKFDFGDNVTQVQPGGLASHTYSNEGVNDYLVTVVATGTGGTTTTETIAISVLSNFDDPITEELLTGGSSKTWFVASQTPGHLGVGPIDTFTPDYFSAAPNQLAECLYDDEITFGLDNNDNITFNHNNNDITFFNVEFLNVGGGGGDSDQCLPYNTSGNKFVSLAGANFGVPEDLTTGTQFTISDEGFMSYYINTSTYEILEITQDYMHIRAISGSASNPLAWYLKFTTNEGSQGNQLETEFTDLIWTEEFDVDGPPNPDVWNFEVGNGDNGWGNQELQYYTENNAEVSDGTLKINLIAESINGYNYSSSRINTLNNFDFNYGRIEIRAKLPEGGGTWPALWMMGSNFPDVGWPFCGEIDIMEHRGNEQDVIHGTLHFPGNSGGDAISQTTNVPGVSQEFNNYTVEWSSENIQFAVNNEVYHVFENNSSVPFNDPFFIILNVAMGGTFGGTVDPNFSQSTMEIDYIRVYQ